MNTRIPIPACHRTAGRTDIPVRPLRWNRNLPLAATALIIASFLLLSACDKNPSRENADIQLNAYANGSGGVELSWAVIRKPSGETWSCHLRRAEANSSDWTGLGEYFPSDEFRCTDTDVTAGTSYKYQVTAGSLLETHYSNIVYVTQ